MTSRVFHRTASLALFATLAFLMMAQPLNAAQRCSNASLQGNYGFLVSGTAADGPITIMGQISADGNGGITGSETVSDNGTIHELVPLTGSYNIHLKCAGGATLIPQGATTSTYNLTVLADGKVQLVGADNGSVQSGFALPQVASSCSTAKTKGVFSLTENGAIVGLGPASFGGQFTLRGNGTIVGTQWGSVAGTISSGDVISGVFKIAKGCNGGGEIFINGGPPNHVDLVVVNNEKEVLFVQSDAGTVLSGSWEQ